MSMRTSGVYKLRYLIQANWTSQLAYRYKLPFCYRLPFRYPIPPEQTNFTNASVTHNPKHPNRVMARVPQTKCQINKLTSVLYSFSHRMHVSLACYHLLRGIWLCQIGSKRSLVGNISKHKLQIYAIKTYTAQNGSSYSTILRNTKWRYSTEINFNGVCVNWPIYNLIIYCSYTI
jgi:hypothetical protein